MARTTICAAGDLVTYEGRTQTALAWALERKIKWQTVKMRRYRGASWAEALRLSRLHSNRWMDNFALGQGGRGGRAVAGPH